MRGFPFAIFLQNGNPVNGGRREALRLKDRCLRWWLIWEQNQKEILHPSATGQASFVQNDKLPYVIVNTVLMVKTVSLSIFIQVYDIGDFESIKGFRQRVAA